MYDNWCTILCTLIQYNKIHCSSTPPVSFLIHILAGYARIPYTHEHQAGDSVHTRTCFSSNDLTLFHSLFFRIFFCVAEYISRTNVRHNKNIHKNRRANSMDSLRVTYFVTAIALVLVVVLNDVCRNNFPLNGRGAYCTVPNVGWAIAKQPSR